ncbi:MAG: M20/M25/M40 family metallo-hydrolase [Bacteroidota bacterium]
MKRKTRILMLLFFSGICLIVFPQKKIPGMKNLSVDTMMKTVTFLSSKELQGRNPGTAGYDLAAAYMADRFSDLKLKPLGDSSYYQWLYVESNEISAPYKFNLLDEKNKIEKEFKLGTDFVFRGFTGSDTVKAPVVFCGYGIYDPDNGYDDFDSTNVARGKIIMIFKPNPKWKNGEVAWPDANERAKALIAKQHRARAILMVSLPNEKYPQKPIGSTLHGEGYQQLQMPLLHINIDAANEILSKTAYTISQLQTIIDSTKKPFSLNTGFRVDLQDSVKYNPDAITENLIGYIEGCDSTLKHQYVLIGAHLDHVGQQAGEIYFPGANDNASGSAAVLEIARTFVKGKIKPKRSVIFVLFASEEQGLLGSKFLAEHLPVPADSIVAAINMDCIGYGDSIQIGNGKSAPELWKFIKELDKNYTRRMVERTWNGGGADLGAFHDKGIPGAYFVTTNSYDNLHWLTDTPETLNQTLYWNIVKLAYATVYKIAMGEYKRENVIK